MAQSGASEATTSAAETRSPKGAAGRFWPAFIITLLVVHVGGVALLIWIATRDPSFQIEENYYEKALAWDQRMEQDRTNMRLGWHSDLSIERAEAEKAYVRARLSDREGLPIVGAEVELVTFHKARAGKVIRSTMRELSPGTYATLLPAKRAGIWEMRLEARRGADRFTQRVDREL